MAFADVALSRWLIVVACLRILSVFIGFFAPDKFKSTVYTNRPDIVTPALGRLFATWTMVTCCLCIICANDINNKAIYGATLASFLIALGYFISEAFIFGTVGIKGLMSPMIVASVSSVWMIIGWDYYIGARAEL